MLSGGPWSLQEGLALTACLSNMGAAIGLAGTSFALLPVASKWILIFAMLAGRLEIFSLLVILMPSYWRR